MNRQKDLTANSFNIKRLMSFIVLMCLPIMLSAASFDTARLLEAHEKAIITYQHPAKDFYKSIGILEKAEIKKIIHSKPADMPLATYVQILNDYGFFLVLASNDKSNKYTVKNFHNADIVMTRVLELDPDRTVAYLNFGDLLWNNRVHRQKNTSNYYQAKELYIKYAELMTKENKQDKIPARIKQIIDSNKLFVLTHDSLPFENNKTFNPCNDYVKLLNQLPENERNLCDRNISQINGSFKLVGDEFLDNIDLRALNNNLYIKKDPIVVEYQGVRFIDHKSGLRQKTFQFYMEKCTYGLLDFSNKKYTRRFVYSCESEKYF